MAARTARQRSAKSTTLLPKEVSGHISGTLCVVATLRMFDRRLASIFSHLWEPRLTETNFRTRRWKSGYPHARTPPPLSVETANTSKSSVQLESTATVQASVGAGDAVVSVHRATCECDVPKFLLPWFR